MVWFFIIVFNIIAGVLRYKYTYKHRSYLRTVKTLITLTTTWHATPDSTQAVLKVSVRTAFSLQPPEARKWLVAFTDSISGIIHSQPGVVEITAQRKKRCWRCNVYFSSIVIERELPMWIERIVEKIAITQLRTFTQSHAILIAQVSWILPGLQFWRYVKKMQTCKIEISVEAKWMQTQQPSFIP